MRFPTTCSSILAGTLLSLVFIGLAPAIAAASVPADHVPAWSTHRVGKTDTRVLAATANGGETSVVILLADQPDLSAAYGITDQDARGWYVYHTLRSHARRSQARLHRALRGAHIAHRSFWIANAIVASGDRALLDWLAARDDVGTIESNLPQRWIEDPPLSDLTQSRTTSGTIEWGVSNVNAPQVWAMGYTGQGIVIGNQDTGMQWDHPALQPHYRGWNGTVADHNFNWHDAVHSGGGICGANTTVPCDDNGHGTHTTGSAVGDDGSGNQIGVAPGAQWIGCRNMDQGNGTPTTYMECFQFFLAPTDLNGNNPDPTRRPHVMNDSWVCPPSEGCAANTLMATVESAEAAGIFVEASAGNSGPTCSTVQDPPAIYAAAFSTGAYDSSNTLATFSSRGPVLSDGSNRMKPDIAAPGVSVRSSWPIDTYIAASGTSMAGPHVVGAVALLWSARPQLARDIATTKSILQDSANPTVILSPAQVCGGISSLSIPNNAFGFGRVDALAAVNAVAVSSPVPTATFSATASATATTSPTPTPTDMISGQARYYASGGAVPGVAVRLHGSSDRTVQTDATGHFVFDNLPDDTWSIIPGKTGDAGQGVSALDAVYILQALAGLRTLDTAQVLACDVTGNGTLSTLDASLILQYKAGLITQFPVAQACGSDWAFIPTPAAAANQTVDQPSTEGGSCQPGTITFTPLQGPLVSQDFLGVLFGDCTGNWQASNGSASVAALAGTRSPALRLGRVHRSRDRWQIPLYVDGGQAFRALDAELSYDTARLVVLGARTMPANRQALLAVNTRTPGRVAVALASNDAVEVQHRPVLLLEVRPVQPGAVGDLRAIRVRVEDAPLPIAGARP